MADVFISYKSERRPAAQHVASIIEAHGFSVWFDYALVPGKNFGRRIEAELRAAKATLVLWCSLSRESEWVHEEAGLAKKLGTFVPARIEPCEPPLGFQRDDYVDLSGWDGDPSTRSLDRLIDRIETLVGREAMIGRRRLVELHTTWTTLGRPRLGQFARVETRPIADEDRRLPSSDGATHASEAPPPQHADAERDWRAHDLDACTDAGLLRAYEAKWKAADPLWAYKAGQKAAALERGAASAASGVRPMGLTPSASLSETLATDIAAARGRDALYALWHQHPERGAEIAARLGTLGYVHVTSGLPGREQSLWLKPGDGRREWFRDHPDGPEMVVIPAGHFMMGSPDDEVGRIDIGHEQAEAVGAEEPRHRVAIARPVAVGRCAVTVDEFAAFVTATGYKMPDEMFTDEEDEVELRKGRSWRNPGFAQAGRHPVVGVSWGDAKAYVQWLSGASGKTYRLLSEAEWEYTCRAGKDTPFWWGKAITPEQANYDGNCTYAGGGTKGVYRKATLPVDCTEEKLEPNPWGLHQMHGNVWEWCEDVWRVSYDGAPADGSARVDADATVSRVVRGGSWSTHPQNLRSAQRFVFRPSLRSSNIGFRLARTLLP